MHSSSLGRRVLPRWSISRFSLRRWTQTTVVALLALVMLGADADTRFNRLGHKMMCACSCGQILLECNHVGCPDSARMIDELHTQVAGGADTAVLNWFVNKYGAIILAAPMRGGFDNVAWITPLAVFALAILGTILLVRLWNRRHTTAVAAGHPSPGLHLPANTTMRDRIRRETEL